MNRKAEAACRQRQASREKHFLTTKRRARHRKPLPLLPEQFSRFGVPSDMIDKSISRAKPTLLSRYISLFDRVGNSSVIS